MTGAWMVYALLVGSLLAGAAWGLEALSRHLRFPVRWVWVGAMALTVGLVLAAPYRAPDARIQVATTAAVLETSSSAAESRGPGAVERVRAAAGARLRWLLTVAGQRVPAPVARYLAAVWLAAGLLVLLLLAATHYRFHRARRGWPLAEVDGRRVRIAPEAGPAVIGLGRPEIVVPRWLLVLGKEERQVVLAHEEEHVRARDPLLLALGCAVAALLPWHPAVWWMLSRLRLGVELDCDARVLRRGIDPGSYGTLLLELAGRSSGLRVGIPALADETSHLERRLIAMTPRLRRYVGARSAAQGGLALLFLLVACEAKMPTAAEINRMDATAAEGSARRFALVDADANAAYTVDGKKVTAAEAKAIPAGEIAQVLVKRKMGEETQSEIQIVTKKAAGTMSLDHERLAAGLHNGDAHQVVRIRVNGESMEGEPLMVVDGVRAEPGALRRLNPQTIESVEVLKGEAAVKAYGADAANGVVKITTKKK